VAQAVGLSIDQDQREAFLLDLCMALRQVPPGVLRDPGKRRLPGDELAEKIAAEAILNHLARCRWQITRTAMPGASPAR
jgi:hypothetical protein